MPNWCFNRLTVTGPEDAIRCFREEAQNGEKPISVHCFMPLPEELEMEVQGSFPQWYIYMNAEVGTKWDVDDPGITRDEANCLEYTFGSAWAPPVGWIVTISREFPELTFKLWFEETGNWFRGEVIVQNEDTISATDLTSEMKEEDYSEDEEKGEKP